MEERDNRLFYGWSVVLGCAVVCGCNIGVLSNTVGVFLKPVSMELGVSRSQIALYSSIFSMVGMLAAPFQGRLMERYSLKKLMVSGAAVGGACLFGYSFAPGLWFFYANAVLCGLVFGFSNLIPVNKILSNWFTKKKGTAVGFALAGSGLMAMVVTPVLSRIVADYGWRNGYRFIGCLYLLLMVPVILFVIKESPGDGKAAAKEDRKAAKTDTKADINPDIKTGLTRAQAMGTRRFWLVLAALVLASSVAMGIQQHMIAYLTDMGYGAQYASGIYSLSMGVLMAGKVILGTLYDRLGIRGASIYICLALAASLGFLIMAGLPGAPYLFAAAFGLANAIQSIPATCLVTRFFGTREFTSIYGICNAGNMAGIALGTSMSAWIYDASGSYAIAWYFYLVLSAVIFLLYMGADREHNQAVLQQCSRVL